MLKNRFNLLVLFILLNIGLINAQKNAITLRPLNMGLSLFGISYERYITHNISLVVYGEYINGPQFLWNGFNNTIRNGFPTAETVDFRYKGWGLEPEVRYYFKELDKKEAEKVLLNDGKIIGWFIGGYVPIRNLTADIKVSSIETFAYGKQIDIGTTSFNQLNYGIGLTGGRHWVWGLFSLEVQAGFAVTNGLNGWFDKKIDINYTRPGIGSYTLEKDLGSLGSYFLFQPKFSINLGIGF